MAIQLDPLSIFPLEVFQGDVLSKMDPEDVAYSTLVCREWRKVASDNALWKRLVPGIPAPAEGVKAFIGKFGVKSIDDVIQRMGYFTDRTQTFKKNTFACFFPFNQDCKIEVELGPWGSSDGEYREICVLMKALPGNGFIQTMTNRKTYAKRISLPMNCSIALPQGSTISMDAVFHQIDAVLTEGAEKIERSVCFSGKF